MFTLPERRPAPGVEAWDAERHARLRPVRLQDEVRLGTTFHQPSTLDLADAAVGSRPQPEAHPGPPGGFEGPFSRAGTSSWSAGMSWWRFRIRPAETSASNSWPVLSARPGSRARSGRAPKIGGGWRRGLTRRSAATGGVTKRRSFWRRSQITGTRAFAVRQRALRARFPSRLHRTPGEPSPLQRVEAAAPHLGQGPDRI
jgi:hypothetical protein